ncbi:MAG: hypothetical protein JWP23_3013, partial [Phenylobacterium sp.]|nr:hypothetical protein [Phenylobacterium sp.]
DYVLVTLGVSLLIGLWLETWKGVFSRPLLVFGRTPLFTYLLHIFLIHGLALLVGMARGLAPADFTHFLTPEASAKLAAEHWGFGLPLVLLIWLLIVAAFYPLSRAYLRLKQTKRAAWMSYL